jgi:dihydroxyacetone kinase-like predicted kinase
MVPMPRGAVTKPVEGTILGVQPLVIWQMSAL